MAPKRSDGLTRRDFLRGTGLGTLGWGVALAAGCGRNSAEAPAQQAEPATEVPAFAEIAPAADLPLYEADSDERKFLLNQLVRGRNKVMLRLARAREAMASFQD